MYYVWVDGRFVHQVGDRKDLHLFSLYVSWDIYFLDLTSGFVDVGLLCLR